MNFLPTKQYRIVPGCGLVYDHENVSTNWPKIQCSRKFNPPKNTRYTVVTASERNTLISIHIYDGTSERCDTVFLRSPFTSGPSGRLATSMATA